MDIALVEHPQNDVDHDNGHDQQQGQSFGGCLVDLGRPLKPGRNGSRQAFSLLFDGCHGRAEGDVRFEIERDRNRGYLPQMVDRKRSKAVFERAER